MKRMKILDVMILTKFWKLQEVKESSKSFSYMLQFVQLQVGGISPYYIQLQ